MAPLEVEPDPLMTHAPADQLQEFEGTWTDPPTPLGVDPVGLEETMTPEDVRAGILRVTILVAPARSAEFIELTFQQQMQR